MKDENFFDTTILVYAHDETDPEKRHVCKTLVERVFRGERRGVVSNQVLAEFFSVLTKNVKNPLKPELAETLVRNFVDSDNWVKINYRYTTVPKAINTLKISGSSFWDSLIAETMKENGFVKILTENLKDFEKISGIKAINPFSGKTF